MKAESSMDRRAFVTSMAAGGALVAGAAGSVAHASEDAGTAAEFDKETDVLVLGAGAGGCYASNFAQQQGASVVLVEADNKVGGTALLSGGFYHTWDITPDNVEQMLPNADPVKRKVFIEKWQDVRDWTLNESNAGATNLDFDYPLYGAHLIGFATGGADFAAGRQKFLENIAGNAEVMLETSLTDLIVDELGAVVGAVVRGKDGKETRIGAKATVIATGSFQNNRGMIEEHLGRWADWAVCRASTYNKGEGIRIALNHGARLSKGCGHFYGHLNPWPVLTPTNDEEYDAADADVSQGIMGAIQKFSVEGIALNMNGRRFTDEGPENYVGDNFLANDTLQQTDGHVFVVIDSAEDHANEIDLIRNAGGIVLQADTVEDLAEQLKEYKVNSKNALKTITEYQEYAAQGKTDELEIPKTPMPTGYLTKLDTPPFYATPATAGISGFYGGIEITEDCEVKGVGDSVIAGLYAAPMAAGGIFYKEYGGGLALCATFGAVAGEAAGKYAKR